MTLAILGLVVERLEGLNARMVAARKVLSEKKWYHSIRLADGRVTDGLLSLESLEGRLAGLPIPADLSGKRVLDIGAWDGFFSFEMERRGARVMAIDCVELDTFRQARQNLGSKVEFREVDVLNLSPRTVGKFDIVLFLGVLYHVKYPLLALERVCSVTGGMAIIESFVTDLLVEEQRRDVPLMEFYETVELADQLDNWWGPNATALRALTRAAGFVRVREIGRTADRASVVGYRTWDDDSDEEIGGTVLGSAFNARGGGLNCYSQKDDFVECWFQAADDVLSRDTVLGRMGQYGVQPVYVKRRGDCWIAIFRLPPGVDPGWHPVRLRTPRSAWSNCIQVAIDMEPVARKIELVGVCDASDWSAGRARQGGHLTLWIKGLPENSDSANLSVYVGELTHRPTYISGEDAAGRRQVNVGLRNEVVSGEFSVFVQLGSVKSNVHDLTVTPQ